MGATIDDIVKKLEEIKQDLDTALKGQSLSAKQIKILSGLSDLDKRLGLIQAGEFRAGNSIDPGKGFSGIRIVYPPVTYSGEEWNIVGVNNDALQVGIRSSDGKLIAGAGKVVLDQTGIGLMGAVAGISYISFYNASDQLSMYFGFDNDNLQIVSDIAGTSFQVRMVMQDATTPYFKYREDDDQVNRGHFSVAGGGQGARITVNGTADEAMVDLRAEGSSGGATFFRLRETTNTPPNPGVRDAFHMYARNDKLIFQWNDSGTIRYYYLDLNSGAGTWTHTTSAP